jgi:hypothetical protein
MAAKRLLVSIALFALAGCASFSTMQTPSTVPKGEVRLGFSAEQVRFSTGDVGVTLPQIEVGVRYGLTDDVDVGGKVYLAGAEAGLKFQFLRGPLDVAIAPAVSYMSMGSTNSTTNSDGVTTSSSAGVSLIGLHAPLLIGVNLTDKVTIGFGPKFLYLIGSATARAGGEENSGTEGLAFMGGFVNLPIRIGKAVWLAPEINAYKPMGESVAGLIWQGGVAFLFGGAPASTALPPPP